MIVTIRDEKLDVIATAEDGSQIKTSDVDTLSKFLQRFPDCVLKFETVDLKSES